MGQVVSKLPCESALTDAGVIVNPVFISDLHLSWRKLGGLRAFFRFLRNEARAYEELFILGDLFEFWVGDDASWIAAPVTAALRRYSASGRKLFLMQGNRDPLLGVDYAKRCGAVLLASGTAIEAKGHRILIAHGDEWCTLDADYQAFRAKLRSREFQEEAFSMSVFKRITWAQEARKRSIAQKRVKSQVEMDVVDEAWLTAARACECRYVVHGHTHRPAIVTKASVKRLVLPDWELDFTTRPHRGWIDVDAALGPRLILD